MVRHQGPFQTMQFANMKKAAGFTPRGATPGNALMTSLLAPVGAPMVRNEDSDFNVIAEFVSEKEGFISKPKRLQKTKYKREKYYTVGIGHYLDRSRESREAFQKAFQNDPTLRDTAAIKELYNNLSKGRGQLTEDQARNLFRIADLPRKIKKARVDTNYDSGRRKGKQKYDPIRDDELFDSLPLNLKKNLISATFRGSWSGSPGTRRLLLQGRPQDAAVEFLDNREYRRAGKPGSKKRGIRPRMEQVSAALNASAIEAEN